MYSLKKHLLLFANRSKGIKDPINQLLTFLVFVLVITIHQCEKNKTKWTSNPLNCTPEDHSMFFSIYDWICLASLFKQLNIN